MAINSAFEKALFPEHSTSQTCGTSLLFDGV